MKRVILLILLPLLLSARALHPVELKINPDSCGGSCSNPDRKATGCCNLKYPGGGFDFVMTTEEDCRNSKYFHKFSDKNDALCFEWKESEIQGTW